MVFTAPQFLYGLIFATIPVIIHIIAKRRVKTLKFSSIMFLLKAVQKSARRYKIRDWLLLLLRILIIVFLVLSIAKPVRYEKFTKGAPSSIKGRKSIILIIDNSLSMGQIIDGEMLFKKAQRVAENIINSQLNQGDNLSVILVSDKIPLKFIDLTYNFKSALELIRNSKISYLRPDIFKSFKIAEELLDKSLYPVRLIYFITDMQKNNFTDEDGNFLNRDLKIKYPVLIINLKTKDVKNSAIIKNELPGVLKFKGDEIKLKLMAKNYSKVKNNLIIKSFLNNEAIGQRSVELEADVDSLIEIETKLNSYGFIPGFSEISDGDDLNLDNRNYFVLYAPQKINIFTTESKNEMFYIISALSPEFIINKSSKGNLEIVYSKYIKFEPKSDLYIISQREFSNNFYDILKRILYSKKSILIFLPPDLNIDSFNNLFSRLNLLPGSILRKVVYNNESNIKLEFIDYTHPALNIFENYRSLNLFNVFQYYKFNLQYSSINFRSLAKFSTGDEAIIEYSPFVSELPDSGKIILFLFPPVPDATDMIYRPSFPALIHQIVRYLAFPRYIELLNKFKVGQSVEDVKNILEIEKSKVEITSLTEDYGIEGDTIVKPGIYKIDSQIFAVNIDFNESDLSVIDFDKLKDNYKNINFTLFNSESDFEQRMLTGLYGKHYWKEFLFIAFLLLIIELFVANEWYKFLKLWR